jgi:hypothetical protein
MVDVQQHQKVSTIVIDNDIRERLKRVGYKGQTYNQIITDLLNLNSNIDSPDRRAEKHKIKRIISLE